MENSTACLQDLSGSNSGDTSTSATWYPRGMKHSLSTRSKNENKFSSCCKFMLSCMSWVTSSDNKNESLSQGYNYILAK